MEHALPTMDGGGIPTSCVQQIQHVRVNDVFFFVFFLFTFQNENTCYFRS